MRDYFFLVDKNEMITLFIVFLVGLGSGMMGAYAGGASLISIPFLIFIGITPDIAVATNRVAQTGLTFTIVLRFLRSDKIQWRFVPIFSALAIIGGVIGAHIVTVIDPKFLQHMLGVIILAFVPVMLFKNRLLKDTPAPHPLWHLTLGYFCYFLVMIFGGFCGGGAMIMMVVITTAFFGFSILQANATNNVSWLLLCLSAVFIFLHKGLINWPVACALMVGTSLGGYFGAHLALAQGEKTVKRIFVGISLFSGVVLLLKLISKKTHSSLFSYDALQHQP